MRRSRGPRFAIRPDDLESDVYALDLDDDGLRVELDRDRDAEENDFGLVELEGGR